MLRVVYAIPSGVYRNFVYMYTRWDLYTRCKGADSVC